MTTDDLKAIAVYLKDQPVPLRAKNMPQLWILRSGERAPKAGEWILLLLLPLETHHAASPRGNSVANLAENMVFLEPCVHLVPPVFRCLFAVAGTIIRMETMWRAGIDLELRRLSCGLQSRFHLIDLRDGNTLVRLAI